MNHSSCVLVVDDNSENLKVLSFILKDAGYQTALALDSNEALQILESNPKFIDIPIISHDLRVPFTTIFGFSNLRENRIDVHDKSSMLTV